MSQRLTAISPVNIQTRVSSRTKSSQKYRLNNISSSLAITKHDFIKLQPLHVQTFDMEELQKTILSQPLSSTSAKKLKPLSIRINDIGKNIFKMNEYSLWSPPASTAQSALPTERQGRNMDINTEETRTTTIETTPNTVLLSPITGKNMGMYSRLEKTARTNSIPIVGNRQRIIDNRKNLTLSSNNTSQMNLLISEMSLPLLSNNLKSKPNKINANLMSMPLKIKPALPLYDEKLVSCDLKKNQTFKTRSTINGPSIEDCIKPILSNHSKAMFKNTEIFLEKSKVFRFN